MKRVPMPPRRTPLARRSAKRRAEEAEYKAGRWQFLRAHPYCQLGVPNVCVRLATEVHHKRGRRGRLLLDQQWWAATCRPCHAYVTEHPELAYVNGWSYRRNQ